MSEIKLTEVKKRGRKPSPNSPKSYFGEREEIAIKEFLATTTAIDRKNYLYGKVIEPALRELVKGVLRMPKFQKIIGLQTMGLNKEQLEEDAYYQVVENMHKFKPATIGKDGQPAKAFSYYGTIIKNYILALKKNADKNINEYGGILDIDQFSEQIPESINKTDVFEDLKRQILQNLETVIETNKKFNKNDLAVGNTLRYMLSNWHKIDFQSKNEFMRMLCHYTHLKPQVVARSLKKLKILAYDSVFKPNSLAQKRRRKAAKHKKEKDI